MGLINAHVDVATGDAYPDSQGADWSAKASWQDWTKWDANPHSPIFYETELDAKRRAYVVPAVDVIMSGGEYTVTASHSIDGVTWSDYEGVGALLDARYVRVKVEASGDYPILHNVESVLLSERKDQTLDDLDTATLTGGYRIDVGDIRLPTPDLLAVLNVQLSFNNTGPGWTYEVVDKDATLGPRVRIYNAAGNPADAVIDALIRGV